MFVLVNDGHAVSAISVDTSHILDLQAALKLQELVYRISGARMPIVDKQFVAVPWMKIHLMWDHFPATARKHPFEISMQESNSDSHNPSKQIIISGSGDDVDRAVSAFTEQTLGIPLEALQDKEYKWERKKVVAIPERLKTINGSFKNN